MARHNLVDRFRMDHPGREIWTWLDISFSVHARSCLDIVFVRRANIDILRVPRSTM